MENYKPHKIGNIIWEHIYSIETYPVSENRQFDVILSRITKEFPDARICWAKHDKDVKDDSTPVNVHYEILFRLPRDRSIQVVADKLAVEVSWLEWKRNWIKSVRYLIHADQPDKYQYDPSIVICSDSRDYKYLTQVQPNQETEDIAVIFDFKDSHPMATMKDLQDFALENNLWATFRRNYTLIKDR